MGNTHSVSHNIPRDSPLAQILAKHQHWLSVGTLKEKELIRLCQKTWPYYCLAGKKQWPIHGSSDPKTILELARHCQLAGLWNQIPYVETFARLLHDPELLKAIRGCWLPAPQEEAGFKRQDQLSAPVRQRAPPPPAPAPASTQPSPTVRQPATSPAASPPANSQPPASSQPSPTARQPAPPPPASPPSPPVQQSAPPPPTPSSAPCHCRCSASVNHQFPDPSPEALQLVRPRRAPPQVASGRVRSHTRFRSEYRDLISIQDFSEDPWVFYYQFVYLVSNHYLTWMDVQIILMRCCTLEDRTRILTKAREFAGRWHILHGNHDVYRLDREAVPEEDPEWDPRDDVEQQQMDYFVACVAEGIRECIKKPEKYHKVMELSQTKEENPTMFLGRLREALGKYSSVDPKSPEGQALLNFHMLTQSAYDIRKHLQKLDVGPTTSLSFLEKEARKVFNNRAQAEAEMLAKMIRAELQKSLLPRRQARRLDPDQCAYCREYGHWKSHCPQLHARGRQPYGSQYQAFIRGVAMIEWD